MPSAERVSCLTAHIHRAVLGFGWLLTMDIWISNPCHSNTQKNCRGRTVATREAIKALQALLTSKA